VVGTSSEAAVPLAPGGAGGTVGLHPVWPIWFVALRRDRARRSAWGDARHGASARPSQNGWRTPVRRCKLLTERVMRGRPSLLVGLGAFLVASSASAEEPIGPAATSAPALTASPDGTPPPAAAPATPPPVEPAPTTAVPNSLAPVEPAPLQPPQTMRDPFRPDGPSTTLSPATTSPADPAPSTTTTTTTTVVVHERPMPQYQAPPRRERFFVGGYGGFGGRLGPTAGRLSVFSNFRGGILLGKRLSIGGSLVQMTKRLGSPIQGTSGKEYQIGLAYGGVDIGIVALRRGRFEIGVNSMFGVGVACIYEREYGRPGDCRESVKLFVAEPGAFMHFNLTDWMRVGFNGGYRFVGRQPWPSGAQFRLAAPYFGANLDFGWFRRRDV
jgi:hypothetical protein